MDIKLKEKIEILNAAVRKENFIEIAYDITEELEGYEDTFETIEPILKLMEQNPDIDFGSPGPLVHFVERYYKVGYEEKLVQSIEKTPTLHTVWMLNRIVNGADGEQKVYYIKVLQNVLNSPNITEELSSRTVEFLSIHI